MVTRSGEYSKQGMLQTTQHLDASKELLRAEKMEDFIPAMEFPMRDVAISFCKCLKKARKHHLKAIEAYTWDLGRSLMAQNGKRAMMFSQTIAKLLVPEFYGGKEVQHGRDATKPTQPNV